MLTRYHVGCLPVLRPLLRLAKGRRPFTSSYNTGPYNTTRGSQSYKTRTGNIQSVTPENFDETDSTHPLHGIQSDVKPSADALELNERHGSKEITVTSDVVVQWTSNPGHL